MVTLLALFVASTAPPAGFTPLFNGRDLTNWKGLVGNPISRKAMSADALAAAQAKADESMRAHWTVKDNVLHFDGKGENLCTAKDYGDFELWIDWKIEPKGDSGLYLRGTPQVQIWDTTDPEQFQHGAEKGSGGLWNNQKGARFPLVNADNPAGQWNTFFVRMVGSNVTINLNGVRVTNDVPLENYWNRELPIFPTGPIELQSHGTHLQFRNIYIRELKTTGK